MGSVRANQIKVEGLGETFANGSGGASAKVIKLAGNTGDFANAGGNVDAYLGTATSILNAYTAYQQGQNLQNAPKQTESTPIIINTPSSEKKGLGTGAIVGISIGAVVVVGAIIYFAVR